METEEIACRDRDTKLSYCITIQEWTWDAADRKPSHGSSRYRDEKSGSRE